LRSCQKAILRTVERVISGEGTNVAYRILYVDNGDVVAQTETFATAYEYLRDFVQKHPELDDEIGIQEISSAGKPIGDMTIGIEVAGQQLAL
jgi:hypothetical protein